MKRGPFVSVLLLFLLFSVGTGLAQADSSPIVCGTYRTLHSTVLGEDRMLLIRLPEGYGKSGKRYPVLYKLDGERDVFLLASSTVAYLADMTDKAPEHILVGIANTDRNRDMRPEQGAGKFIAFLKTELLPFIDKNYRINGFDILAGQSLSSVFALYSFLKEPGLFDGYLLSSFMLPTEDFGTVFHDELKKSQGLKTTGKTYIFVANGRIDSYDTDGTRTKRGDVFLDSLKQAAPAAVQVKYKMYDDEGHVPFPTIYDGLKWIYSQEKGSTN